MESRFQCEVVEEGWLRVSEKHELHFELYGNQNGEPALYLHGGPGSGASTASSQWFDPDRYRIVLLDQRGSGKSKPLSELQENTTSALVSDIETLRNHLNIKEWSLIFGGSWGSFLALAYLHHLFQNNINVPIKRVVMYGIFLGREEDIYQIYESKGVGALTYPDAFSDFLDPIASIQDDSLSNVEKYGKLFSNPDHNDPEFENAVFCWCQWDSRTANAFVTPSEWGEQAERLKERKEYLVSHSLIEQLYFEKRCWMDGNLFLKNEFAQAIKNHKIEIRIVCGRFDVVCPPYQAHALYQNFKSNHVDCEMKTVLAGHTASYKTVGDELMAYSNPHKLNE